MSIEIWVAFVLAAMVLVIIPGPTIILVISQAIAHGRRAVLPLVVGVTLGDFTAMTHTFPSGAWSDPIVLCSAFFCA